MSTDLEDMYHAELDEYHRLENYYDCALLGSKINDYFEGDNARMFTLAQEILAMCSPSTSIADIEHEERRSA